MSRPGCFVVMPFRPELNYFYLFLQHHLKETFHVEVERGDARYPPGALMSKIERMIDEAEFLIIDISGNNENVLIELGIALALRKDIILITSGIDENDIPTDVRHLEYIQYDLQNHEEFLSKLGRAIKSILVDYEALYQKALDLLGEFNLESGIQHDAVGRDQFKVNIKKWAGRGGIPGDEDRIAQAEILLPQILSDPADAETRKQIQSWQENLDSKPSHGSA
jgi:hypothetical protein